MTSDEQRTTNVHQTRVRSHQTDLNGSMYHGAFFDVFDDARIDVFRRLGYSYERAVAGGWQLVIRRAECEYHLPATLDQVLDIAVKVESIRPATLTCRYECSNAARLIAVGRVVYVFLNRRGRPMRFPADLRSLIEECAGILAYGGKVEPMAGLEPAT